MKEPFENLLKQSLEGHEMPYSPDAWSAMQARLDVVSPVQVPRSNARYYIAAAGLGLTALATYFIFTYNSSPEDTVQPQLVQNETASSESSNSASVAPSKNGVTNTTNADISTENSNGSSVNGNSSTTNPTDSPVKANGNNSPFGKQVIPGIPDPSKGQPSIVDAGTKSTPVINTDPQTNASIKIPSISNLCLNEVITIENTNDRAIVILQPDGRNFAIAAGKVVEYRPTMEGNYAIGYMANADFRSKGTFVVQPAPESDFSIDFVNKFEDGIPTTHVTTGAQGDSYTWNSGKQSASGSEADFHFYKKGKETISLTVSDGVCSSTSEKSFYVEEDYNLMAVAAFTPSSSDPRNSTFMPFALTQRDVKFKLLIFDSKNGGIVYETSDASLPWDGTDKRTGLRNTDIATYIWKVVLMNPEPNQPAEYRGTIVKQ